MVFLPSLFNVSTLPGSGFDQAMRLRFLLTGYTNYIARKVTPLEK